MNGSTAPVHIFFLDAAQGLSAALESFPSPSHTLTEGGHTAGEAADYVFGEVTTILQAVSGERGLLRYLAAIQVRRHIFLLRQGGASATT